MKQLTSATLICILLFNLVGYRFVAEYMQQRSDAQLEACLDNSQYDESQLIEFKIPIDLPYQTSWADFERYDGEIQLNGIIYKYVKRKISNDTLVLLCIPNQQKMKLQTAKDDFFKNSYDLAQNNNSKNSDNSKSISFKKLMSEYDESLFGFKATSMYCSCQNFGIGYLVTNPANSAHMSPEQPPDSILL